MTTTNGRPLAEGRPFNTATHVAPMVAEDTLRHVMIAYFKGVAESACTCGAHRAAHRAESIERSRAAIHTMVTQIADAHVRRRD